MVIGDEVMSQIDDTLKLIDDAINAIETKYGNHAFKKGAKKKWEELYERHLRELKYLFTTQEVKTAYSNAVDDFIFFCQANASLRKR